jgi:ankyrin repeat protein
MGNSASSSLPERSDSVFLARASEELQAAVTAGEERRVYELLHTEEADVLQRDGDLPLLFIPIQRKNDDIAHLLISRGATQSIQRDFGPRYGSEKVSSADVAAWYGNRAIMERLIKAEARMGRSGPGYSKLHLAAYRGNAAIIVCLLGAEEGAPTPSLTTDELDCDQQTALMLAAGRGFKFAVNVLLRFHASPTAENSTGTALHQAAAGPAYWWGGDRRIDDFGKSLEVGSDGSNLPQPSDQDYRDVIKALIAAGSGLEVAAAGASHSPLLTACKYRHWAAIAELLLAGADVEARGRHYVGAWQLLGVSHPEEAADGAAEGEDAAGEPDRRRAALSPKALALLRFAESQMRERAGGASSLGAANVKRAEADAAPSAPEEITAASLAAELADPTDPTSAAAADEIF